VDLRSRFMLAEIHRDLFDIHEARRQFEQALALAHELGSGNWISSVTGSLASTLLASGATQQQQRCSTPVRWKLARIHGTATGPPATAELALRQGEAERALMLLDSLRGDTAPAPGGGSGAGASTAGARPT